MAQCAGPTCLEAFTPKVWNQRFHSPLCKRAWENAQRRQIEEIIAPADEASTLDYLRSENRRLSNAAEKAKNHKAELIGAVYQSIADNIAAVKVRTSKAPRLRSSVGAPEVAAVGVSDWQLSKVTSTYNTDICEERVELYGDKIISITEVQRSDHPVSDVHLWVVGDIVEGEMIFAGQSHLLDRSLYAQVAKDGPRILGNFVRRLLGQFETVHFVGIIGNHGSAGGRARKEYNSETNMDRILYQIIKLIFADEPRVTFDIPDGFGERSFYAVDTIGNLSTLLCHGDQFPSPTALHAYQKKILAWRSGGIPEPFQQVFMGHYHQNLKASFGDIVLRIGGSPESTNTFAQEVIGFMGKPSQHMQFISPSKGEVTAEYDVWL